MAYMSGCLCHSIWSITSIYFWHSPLKLQSHSVASAPRQKGSRCKTAFSNGFVGPITAGQSGVVECWVYLESASYHIRSRA